jgi:hypothetical protein
MSTTESVSEYKIYCETESQYVRGWSPVVPSECFNNKDHTVNNGLINVLETVFNKKTTNITVSKYRVFCNDEQKFIEGWSEDEPVLCFNNNSHKINLNSIQVVETISDSQVKIIEDNISVSRNIKVETLSVVDVPADSSTSSTYVFKSTASMYSVRFHTDVSNSGDEVSLTVNPNSTIGVITSPITAGDTVINPPITMFSFKGLGFSAKVTDGVNTNNLGRILSMDHLNETIEVENAAIDDFAAGSVFQISYHIMENVLLGAPGAYTFGDDMIGGVPVPRDTNLLLTYKNNDSAGSGNPPKMIVMYLSVLF